MSALNPSLVQPSTVFVGLVICCLLLMLLIIYVLIGLYRLV